MLVTHLDDHHPRAVPGQWCRWARHRSWTLDYCGWEGMHCEVGEDGSIAPAAARAPNTWHLYAPNVTYRERYERPELCKEDMWVQFALARRWGPLKGRRFAVIADPAGRIADYVRSMYVHQQHGRPGSGVVIHGLFVAMLGEIGAAARRGDAGTGEAPWRVESPEEAAGAREDRLLHRVDRIVSDALSSPPSLDELAEALHMSVSSLAHRFKAETGFTVVDRVRWLRIREARRLLAQPGATVKGAAHELGFSSPAYFSRVFTEVSGITPVSYLQRATGTAEGR